MSMIPYKIAMLCVLLPLVTVHLTLTLAIALGHLESCIPYWSRCHSISATGRQYPEFFVFKALMIPTAVFMSCYWLLVQAWLKKFNAKHYDSKLIPVLGCTAAMMLIVYTVTLGAVGEPYALARRIGVVFYFSFSSFAHLLLLRELRQINTTALHIASEKTAMFYVCLVMLVSALFSAFAGFFWQGWDNWENAYEWWFSLTMISLFYLVARIWKKTRFNLSVS